MALAMDMKGVMPLPPARATTFLQSRMPECVTWPPGSVAVSLSPALASLCSQAERKPPSLSFTVMRYLPSSASFGLEERE